MIRWLTLVLHLAVAGLKSRRNLLLEIIALRHQLFVLSRNSKRPCLHMANCHSSGDWQFKQPVAMALPTVILKAGWLRCWAARYLPGCVAR